MKPEILGEKPITIAEAKKELDRIKKRDEELSFRGNKAEEYFQQFSFINDKKASELAKALEDLKIPRLKEAHISKIVDVLPQTVSEIKTLLQGYTVTVKEEFMKKIIEVVNKYPAQK